MVFPTLSWSGSRKRNNGAMGNQAVYENVHIKMANVLRYLEASNKVKWATSRCNGFRRSCCRINSRQEDAEANVTLEFDAIAGFTRAEKSRGPSALVFGGSSHGHGSHR